MFVGAIVVGGGLWIFSRPLAAHQVHLSVYLRRPGIFRGIARDSAAAARLTAMEGAEHSTSGENGVSPATTAVFARTERRIAWLTLVLGSAAAIIVAILRYAAWAEGLAIGTVLAWLNFRWLRRGLDALVAVATAQEGGCQAANPAWNVVSA